MSTELVGTGTATLSSVADVTTELQIVALNADQMRVAQGRMAEWFSAKEAIARKDYEDLIESLDIAIEQKWDHRALDRQVNNALLRVEFFEKCKVASERGYCIVPNMPADCFAIRTTAEGPSADPSFWKREQRTQGSDCPPLDEGGWKDSDPKVSSRMAFTGKEKDGLPERKRQYFGSDFKEVEFPISIAKPEIMSAAVGAMMLKCFDDLAVLPARRGKGDPLVLGRIYKPGTSRRWIGGMRMPDHITFLVAWYIDTRAL